MFKSFKLMTPIVWLTRLLVGAYPHWQGCAPSSKQRIYFANHTSHLDTIVIWASLPPQLRPFVRPVAAKDYWEKGLLRRRIALDELNVVLVDRRRTEHSNPLDPLRQALQEGSSLSVMRLFQKRPTLKGMITALPVPTVCSIRFGAPLEHSPEDLKEDFLERARNAIISLAQP